MADPPPQPTRPPLPASQPSVRIRRATISQQPTSPQPQPQPQQDGLELQQRSASPEAMFTTTTTTTPPSGSPPSPVLQGSGSTRRKRAATLTQRLFADSYLPLRSASASGDDHAVLVEESTPTDERGGRGRSPSLQSASDNGVARATSPVVVVQRRRGSTISSNNNNNNTGEEGVVRKGSLGRRGRGRTLTMGSMRVDEGPEGERELHKGEEVDVLEVLDQQISTTAHLSNIQSAFLPNIFNKQPVVQLDQLTPTLEESEEGAGLSGGVTPTSQEGDEEEVDPLDLHLAKLLKKQKRKEKARLMLKGIWAFLKTPIGVFFGIYGILVVFWGAALVLILVGAVPMSSYNKKLWVEIASQILTGLFCITSLLPLPWRILDWWYIHIIWKSARLTRNRRRNMGLEPLRDENDLPDPRGAEYWVSSGGEKLTGPRPAPSAQPPRKPKKGGVVAPSPPSPSKLESAQICTDPSDNDNDIVVLTDEEEDRLRDAQVKFARSQTWYRPHTTPTHHASPIKFALWIAVLMIGNSVFQALLCVAMWGWNRFTRPAWTTGCLIPLSFGCGIAAAILIWQSGERTKRKAEVTRAMWKMLKKDEEELEARRKKAAEERERRKADKKKLGHGHGHAHAVSVSVSAEEHGTKSEEKEG